MKHASYIYTECTIRQQYETKEESSRGETEPSGGEAEPSGGEAETSVV